MPLLLRRVLMHDAWPKSIPEYRYSSIRGPLHGPQGVYGISIYASASDKPCSYVNHYRFSFGLDDRYGDPYCDRFL